MYAHHFAGLLADWLATAHHPGIVRACTCADIGRHEQPVGVALTLSDGWMWILQTVGGAPPGGDVNRSGESTRPAPFEGAWVDRADYRAARTSFEQAQAGFDGPRSRAPQASHAALMDVALDAVRQAAHAEVASVEVPGDRLVLIVAFVDGSKVYGYPAGFIAPGTAELVKA